MEKVVAVTGGAGYIGTQLLEWLESDPAVQKIVCLDLRRPVAKFTKLTSYEVDVTKDFSEIFVKEGVTSAIHLVFVVNPSHNRKQMTAVNIESARHFFAACEVASVKRQVVVSSTTAYGAHADNPVPLREENLLRGNADFVYSNDKVEVERLCEDMRKRHKDWRLTVIRPPIVMGPTVDNFLARFMRKKWVFLIKGFDPSMQFIHEKDVGRMIYLLWRDGGSEAYNVGPNDWVTLTEVANLFGANPSWLPPAVIYPLCDVGWCLRMQSLTEAPSSVLRFIQYPWVATTEKVARSLGHRCEFTSRQAIEDAARAILIQK